MSVPVVGRLDHLLRAYVCCWFAGMSRDASLFRSIPRAATSSSKDATNSEHLANSSRLLLSLSPHVVVPDALEKEQQHEAAVQLHQQRRAKAALDQQQQQHEHDELQEQQHDHQQQKERWPLANGSIKDLQESVAAITIGTKAAAAAAVVAGPASAVEATAAEAEAVAAATESEGAPSTPSSSVLLAEHEFTDPLRRVTHQDDDDLLSDDDGGAAVAAAAAAVGSEAVLQVDPLWVQGLQLYDR